MKTLAAISLALSLSPAFAADQVVDIVVIGNSLTLSPPNEKVGWSGNWGMAAGTQEADFAHIAARKMGLPVQAFNFAELERKPEIGRPQIPTYAAHVSPYSLVVVELGDNVPVDGAPAFAPAYEQLLASVKGGKRLVCVSTWWRDEDKDAVIRKACKSAGGRYVYIGDVRGIEANPDIGKKPYRMRSVNDHPQDWSMSEIARRVVAALRGKPTPKSIAQR
jgi:hypothetical protein